MTDIERKKKAIINIIYVFMIIALGFLFVRYALGVCFPIVCAFFIATILQRPKNFLTRKTFLKKGAASVVSLFALIFIVISSETCYFILNLNKQSKMLSKQQHREAHRKPPARECDRQEP